MGIEKCQFVEKQIALNYCLELQLGVSLSGKRPINDIMPYTDYSHMYPRHMLINSITT